jgi:hypothetical protein
MLIIDYGLKNYVTIVHKVLRYNIFNTILYIEYNIVYCVTCTVLRVLYIVLRVVLYTILHSIIHSVTYGVMCYNIA